MSKSRLVFRRLLKSYIILVLFFTFGAGIGIIQVEKVVKNLTLFGHQATMKQLTNNIENLFSNAEERILYFYKTREDILKENHAWQDLNVKLDTQDILNAIEVAKKGIYPFFFYGEDLLSSSMIIKPEQFFKYFIDSSSLSIAEWMKILNGKNYGSVYPVRVTLSDDGLSNALAIVMSDFFEYEKDSVPANLIIFIKNTSILNLIEENSWLAQGEVFILDQKDQLLFSSISSKNEKEDLPQEKALLFYKNGYTYLQRPLVYSDLKLMLRYPDSEFQKQVRLLRLAAIISLILILIIGMLLSYMFSNRQYSPVKDLMSILNRDDKEDASVNNTISEYQYIRNGILEIIEENETIQNRLDAQQSTLNRYFTGRVLQGEIEGIHEEIYEYFLQRGLVATSGDYLIATLLLEDSAEDSIKNMFEYLEDILKKNLDLTYWSGMVQPYSSFIIFTEKKSQRYICDKLDMIRKDILKDGVYRFSIGVSTVDCDFSSIPDLFRESLSAIDQRLQCKQAGCFRAGISDKKNKGLKNLFDSGLTHKFINTINSGEYQDAFKLILLELNKLENNKNLSPRTIQIRLTGILNLFLEGINGTSLFLYMDDKEYQRALQALFNGSTIEHIQKEMDLLIQMIIKEAEEKKEQCSNDIFLNQIYEIVEKHITDIQLNVNFIADKKGWPVSSVSSKFKRTTGVCLLDYIHKERIKIAKHRMKSDPLSSIKEISRNLGYWNSNVFIKVFKKYEGITPGKYLKLHNDVLSTNGK